MKNENIPVTPIDVMEIEREARRLRAAAIRDAVHSLRVWVLRPRGTGVRHTA